MRYIIFGEDTFEGESKFKRVLVEADTLQKAIIDMNLQGIRVADVYKQIEWRVVER